ncbi:hypothetical protein [Sphingomonas gellani]|nr:hypothetical protein [Sphingomonas gellani]
MKLPADEVRAKAYRKVPDEFGGLFRIIPLSDATFVEAKESLSRLTEEEIIDAFVWTNDCTFRGVDVLSLLRGEKIAGNPPRTHRDDWDEAGQIAGSLSEVRQIADTGILRPDRYRDPLFRSAITSVLIHLKDLLYKARVAGMPTTISDERGDTNLLDVIPSARDAACHVTSKKVQVGPSRVRYGISRGPDAGAMIDGVQLGCPFPDEVAVFFGPNRVYLNRDILTAYHHLRDYYGDDGLASDSTKA